MDKHKSSWESKKPQAYFRGLPTGTIKNEKNMNAGRLKLVMDSIKRPDLLDATFSGVLTGEDWIKDEVPANKFADRLNLC